jgi:hypothetical protein
MDTTIESSRRRRGADRMCLCLPALIVLAVAMAGTTAGAMAGTTTGTAAGTTTGATAAVATPVAAVAAGKADAPERAETDWEGTTGAGRFGPLGWLIGEWKGYGKFEDRVTYIRKHFAYELAGHFLVERTVDMFPPKEPSTEFELHQDFTVYSRENDTGRLRARGFFVESYVTRADVEASEDGSRIVVEALEIENGPPGMRYRFTITRVNDDRFTALFELAMPGREYRPLEQLEMARVR